jgi:hypothetical protein
MRPAPPQSRLSSMSASLRRRSSANESPPRPSLLRYADVTTSGVAASAYKGFPGSQSAVRWRGLRCTRCAAGPHPPRWEIRDVAVPGRGRRYRRRRRSLTRAARAGVPDMRSAGSPRPQCRLVHPLHRVQRHGLMGRAYRRVPGASPDRDHLDPQRIADECAVRPASAYDTMTWGAGSPTFTGTQIFGPGGTQHATIGPTTSTPAVTGP